MAELRVLPSNKRYPLTAAVSLLNTLLRGGSPIPHKCGGKIRCGTCRILVTGGADKLSPLGDEERALLGEEAISRGMRLACQTYSFGDVSIEIPPAPKDAKEGP